VRTLLCIFELRGAERNADAVDAVVFDGTQDGGAPAAANVEQPLPRLQLALAERQPNLGFLSLIERHLVALEVSARIDHRRAQEQPIKVVRQVVMGLNLLIWRTECGRHAWCGCEWFSANHNR